LKIKSIKFENLPELYFSESTTGQNKMDYANFPKYFFYSWHLCIKSEQIIWSGQELKKYFFEICKTLYFGHKGRIKIGGRHPWPVCEISKKK
jgi:hypothetical protein